MVTVENIKPIQNAGNLRAFATINVGGRVRISDVRIVQQPGKAPWVSMPSRAYEKDGERKWAATVELIDDALKTAVSTAVLDEYRKLNPNQDRESVPAGW